MPKQSKESHCVGDCDVCDAPPPRTRDLMRLTDEHALLAAEGGCPVYVIAPAFTTGDAARDAKLSFEQAKIEDVLRLPETARYHFGVKRSDVLRAVYVCRACGSSEVEHAFWANINGEQNVSDAFGTWNELDAVFCNGCGSHAGVITLYEYQEAQRKQRKG